MICCGREDLVEGGLVGWGGVGGGGVIEVEVDERKGTSNQARAPRTGLKSSGFERLSMWRTGASCSLSVV